MKIFQRNSDSKNRKQEKRSLIRILYIYPVAFFLVGLSTIITYYTWLQINEYNKHVEKLKSEFPEKQRTALKSRVLVLKDYIGWVKSHPDEYTIQMLNNRILIAEHLFSSYKNDKNFSSENIPAGITDSLDEANKRSIIKIIILNNNNEVIYPQFPFRHREGE